MLDQLRYGPIFRYGVWRGGAARFEWREIAQGAVDADIRSAAAFSITGSQPRTNAGRTLRAPAGNSHLGRQDQYRDSQRL